MTEFLDGLRSLTFGSMVLLAETVFFSFGQQIRHHPEYTLEIQYNDKNSLDNVLRYCKDSGMTICNLKIHTRDGKPGALYAAEVHLRGAEKADMLTTHILQMPGADSVCTL